MGDSDYMNSSKFMTYKTKTDEMRKAYLARDWEAAEQAAKDASKLPGSPTVLYTMYLDRIESYKKNPPSEDWRGIYIAVTK